MEEAHEDALQKLQASLDQMTEKEIRHAKQIERAVEKGFRNLSPGQDTIRIQLEKDTVYLK